MKTPLKIVAGNCYIVKIKDRREIACVCIAIETEKFYQLIDQESGDITWTAKSDFGFNSDGYRLLENVTKYISEKRLSNNSDI